MHNMKLIHIQQFQINMLFFICVSSSNSSSYKYFYIQRSHLVSGLVSWEYIYTYIYIHV